MRCVAVPHILWLPLWGSWHGGAVTERVYRNRNFSDEWDRRIFFSRSGENTTAQHIM